MYCSPSRAISACSFETSGREMCRSDVVRRPIVSSGLLSTTTRVPCESMTLRRTSDNGRLHRYVTGGRDRLHVVWTVVGADRLDFSWVAFKSAGDARSPSLLPFRIFQPLRHLRVVHRIERPTPCRTVPAVVLDGHVDAAVDEELHRLVVPLKEDQMVQDARWFV